MNFCYKFPVVRGVQAGREYYIAMVPLDTLEKLFPNENEYVLPENRAQRRLNEPRIPKIKKYILENRDSYVFSALAASIDGKHQFIPSNQGELGILEVDMNAKFLINDGQHRKAAIIAALEEDSTIGNETISVVFYEDQGLARSQQMFTDLNKHAVKTSNSIAELYDSRDQLAVATRTMILEIPFLDEYVDRERDNLGKFSSSLFALNNFYTANKKILGRREYSVEFEYFLKKFWKSVVDHMLPWQDLVRRDITKRDLREQYIASQAVVIKALGRIGAALIDEDINTIDNKLKALERINWRRNASIWEGRVIRNDGKMLTSNMAIVLAGNVIKKELDLALTEEEDFAEAKFGKNK
ncbi:MAG: DNA sulfur modification protein DndB [Lachnospiraceae bacterium]|nr:DNA sulfur modification protein DndB [Lachnospiraceae bacterium]